MISLLSSIILFFAHLHRQVRRGFAGAAICSIVVTCLWVDSAIAGDNEDGVARFDGELTLERIDDDPFLPKVRLLDELRFRQATGQVWETPGNVILDGRSMPTLFVQLFGGFLEGDFRKTAVTYDYAVKRKPYSWQETHRMFYEGVMTEGVAGVESKAMYLLLMASGTRWAQHGPNSCFSRCHTDAKELEWRPRVDDEKLVSLLNWVRTEDPALAVIEQRAEEAIIEEGPHIFGVIK